MIVKSLNILRSVTIHYVNPHYKAVPRVCPKIEHKQHWLCGWWLKFIINGAIAL
jgi:hypothetical protein